MGWTEIAVIAVTLCFLIYMYVRYTNAYAKKMMKIGVAAAHTYLLTGQNDALIAAKTVKAGMSQLHSKQLMALINHLPNTSDDKEIDDERFEKMMSEIYLSRVGVAAATEFRNELKSMNSSWLGVILKCNTEMADKAFIEATIKSAKEDQ